MAIVVQLLSHVQLCATSWTAAQQAFLSFTIFRSLLKFKSIESVMLSDHVIFCTPLPPFAIHLSQHQGLFSELFLWIRWLKYWSFSFSISSSNEYSGLVSFRVDWFDRFAVQGTLKSSPTPQSKSIDSSALSLLCGLTLTSVHDYWKNHRFD